MVVGAAALFVANALGGWAMLIVVPVLGCLWIWLALDGIVKGWRHRAIGAPALILPAIAILVIPFAGFFASHALYWSHVAPSWWRLRSDRTAFESAVRGGPVPPDVTRIERAGQRTAFGTANGLFGAWAGIVHDPTDRMAAARGWNNRPIPDDVAAAFVNRIIWCQRLDSHWFHCQFE